jgi:hypothetical protein
MLSDFLTVPYLFAVVGLLAVIGLLVAIGLYVKLARVNGKLKAIDDLLDIIHDQTDLKREEKISALAKQLKKAFPEIADGIDNTGFGESVYNAHKVYRKAVSYYGSPGSNSWSRKANAKSNTLADTVNGFYGYSLIKRIPNSEWKKRVATFIRIGA